MDTYLNLARNCTCWQRPLMQVLVIVAAMGISLCHCYAASPYTPDAGNDDRQLEKSPNLLTKPTLSDCIGYYKWADKKLRLYTEEEIREATAGDPVIQSIKEECIGSQGEKADYFHGIDFVNNLEGWAAGWNGKILHTADGGASWREQASGTRKHLMSVDFVDAQHGWAVGHEGVVLHTSNGGKTWMTQAVLGNIILEKISCPTRLNCWIGSHYQGFVFATSDGGIKWQRQATKHKGAVKSIFFSDQMKGWAVTGIGEVVKTNDGGKSWMLKTVSKPAQLTGIHFSSPSLGWITGMDGSLYQSRDGGETWEDASDGLRPLAGNVGMGYLDLMNVHFVDSLVGWLVGLNGIIVATRDGGKNWFVQQDEVNAVSSLYGVSFVGKSRGWASGNMGHIYAYG